ncbi:Protein of unknown function [Bryocella elongata]|uniref:DUF2393 domain-containing protein n=1 Tax=Bryocella elongata TaxID=863522 RepID=A0A1H6BP30_9BACT|nr:DUF2393 family protein [Bryocella elongata]SEG62205.1 Protein of unknown function [Bryocella elongata]
MNVSRMVQEQDGPMNGSDKNRMFEPGTSPMFATPRTEQRSFPTTAVAIAAAAVVFLVTALVLLGRHSEAVDANLKTLQPAAAYAASLPVTGLAMSESTSFSGAKQLYIDGHIANNGSSTVTGVTVQVVFGNVVGNAPHIETEPMMLIRAREPYIDVEPVNAAPIAPGKSADFRLTFERVDPNWDQQMPEIRLVRVGKK